MKSPTAVAGSAADISEALPSPTSPAAVPCHSSPGRHYYLAVDRTQFKMRTLLELRGVVADRRGGLPIATCVSSCDELDAVCAAVANLSFVSMLPLEAYLRRMSTCLVADGIVINMVVGGEVATLKALEENSGLLIAEMPIHVSEIL